MSLTQVHILPKFWGRQCFSRFSTGHESSLECSGHMIYISEQLPLGQTAAKVRSPTILLKNTAFGELDALWWNIVPLTRKFANILFLARIHETDVPKYGQNFSGERVSTEYALSAQDAASCCARQECRTWAGTSSLSVFKSRVLGSVSSGSAVLYEVRDYPAS